MYILWEWGKPGTGRRKIAMCSLMGDGDDD
jgi:hypothetical protein